MRGDRATCAAAALLSIALAGCIETVDLATVEELRRAARLAVIADGSTPEGARMLGAMRGLSCARGAGRGAVDPEAAMLELRVKAARAGANALTKVSCNGDAATAFANNCWRAVLCTADALSIDEQSYAAIAPRGRAIPEAPLPGGKGRPAGSGTAFFVSRDGHAMTNAHVVRQCAKVEGRLDGVTREMTIVALDEQNDLAVLRWPEPVAEFAAFRGARPRPGDPIVAVGFPLQGLLAPTPIVTTGNISALAGLGGDSRYLQITAPIQPGNSGGPLLDDAGDVVGVVAMKLDEIAIARQRGVFPQNVNFAINASGARAFLETYRVDFRVAPASATRAPGEIGDRASRFVLPVTCIR